MQIVKVKEVHLHFIDGEHVKVAGFAKKVKAAKLVVQERFPGSRWWGLIKQSGTWYYATWNGHVVCKMTLIVEAICSPASNGA